jgi:hypothetical protein
MQIQYVYMALKNKIKTSTYDICSMHSIHPVRSHPVDIGDIAVAHHRAQPLGRDLGFCHGPWMEMNSNGL